MNDTPRPFSCPDCGAELVPVTACTATCPRCGDDVDIANGSADGVREPDPPTELPQSLREELQDLDADSLRRVGDYADDLADYRELEAQRELEERVTQDVDETPDGWGEADWRAAIESVRGDGDVPAAKGTLTTRTVDGDDHYYLQWRDGEQIRHRKVAPVDPSS